MLNGPLLVTDRLILRPPSAEDFDAFAEMCAEEETMRFIGGACPRSAAWRQWCTLAGAWHIRGFSMFSVIERASGEWVGRSEEHTSELQSLMRSSYAVFCLKKKKHKKKIMTKNIY